MHYKDKIGQIIRVGDYALTEYCGFIGRILILPTKQSGADSSGFGLIIVPGIWPFSYEFSKYPFVDNLIISKTFKMQHRLHWSFSIDFTICSKPEDFEIEFPQLSI